MNNSPNVRENSPEGAASSSQNAPHKKLVMTRRQAIATGILAALTGVVALESANKEKVSGWINKLFTSYDVNTGEDLKSIEKKNIPLSQDLSCDITVNFRTTGKVEGKDNHIPRITVSVNGLPPNPNGTKNTIHFILEPSQTTTDRGLEYSFHTTTSTNFGQDPEEEDIEFIRERLGEMEAEDSVSDSVTTLERFRSPNLQPYLDIKKMTDEKEIAPLARSITKVSLAEFEAKQLASALAGNSEG